MPKIANVGIFCHFVPLTGSKTLQKHLYLLEEVLRFNLVGYMWKLVKNWLQEWVLKIYKWKWGRSRWIAYFENYLQKQLGDRYGECPIAFPTRFTAEFPTEFPARFPTRSSCKNFPQEFPTRFPIEFPTKFPTEFPAEFPTRFPTEFPTEFPARFPRKICLLCGVRECSLMESLECLQGKNNQKVIVLKIHLVPNAITCQDSQ